MRRAPSEQVEKAFFDLLQLSLKAEVGAPKVRLDHAVCGGQVGVADEFDVVLRTQRG